MRIYGLLRRALRPMLAVIALWYWFVSMTALIIDQFDVFMFEH